MRSLLGVLNIFGSLLAWFALYFLLPIVTGLLFGEILPLRGFVAGAAICVLGGILLAFFLEFFVCDFKSNPSANECPRYNTDAV